MLTPQTKQIFIHSGLLDKTTLNQLLDSPALKEEDAQVHNYIRTKINTEQGLKPQISFKSGELIRGKLLTVTQSSYEAIKTYEENRNFCEKDIYVSVIDPFLKETDFPSTFATFFVPKIKCEGGRNWLFPDFEKEYLKEN
ncbi:MAG: hypothetical protein KC535_00355 [Nanoarchaeota archaeon]|nr:hypothetical protein [Nanoarchaeota archaeon]